MNFYLLIPATAFLLDFFLMTYLFAASDRHRATRAYLLFCGAITLWQASEFFLWTELPDSALIVILRLTSPLYLSVGLLFLNFIHDFIQKKRGVLFFIHTAFMVLGVILVIFTDLHIRPVIMRYHWGTTPLLGPLYPHIAVTVMILPVLTGMFLLARYHYFASDHIILRQSRLIFTGLFLTATSAAFANLIIPLWFGDYGFPRLASSLMAIQSVFIFISIVRYRLFMISFEKNAYMIYNSIQDGVIILDRLGMIHDINATASRIIGVDESLVKGTLFKDVIPRDFPSDNGQINRLLEIGPEEDRRTVLVSQSPITRGRITTGRLIILKDITAISRAEKDSQLYQERFTKAFNLSPIPMSINRVSDAVYVDVNESQCRITGYSRDEYLGKPVGEITLFDSQREYGLFKQRILSQGKVSNFECRFRMKNGEIRYGMLSAEVFSIDSTAYVITCANDITDRLKMEAEILKTSKLESLGVFAGGIAHDFNNLLTAIIGNISLAKIHGAENEKSLEVLEEAERASLRAKDLTRQLLTFSRGGAPIKKVMPLNALLTDAANFALRGSAVKRRLGIPEDLWHANIDEGQVTQVFHNLVLNARQSMPGGGTIGIDAANMEIRAGEPTSIRPGKYVHICVTDEGVGISQENISKIFDPFFTTKEKGSGLGLTISYSIIRRHEGHISAELRPGGGAAFHVYLPASEKRAESARENAAAPVTGKGRILVVDDEDFVLKVAGEMLSRMGYDIETALSGEQALEMYSQALNRKMRFDCIIIDLTIRGSMGGLEIMTRLKEIDPGVTAIVSSGYSNDPVMSNYRNHGFSGIVPKPYSYSELESIMKTVVKQS